MTETVLARTDVVVLSGEAYRGARQRFYHLILELLAEPITAALLTSQFSDFYRGLAEGDRFEFQLISDESRLLLRLLLEHDGQKVEQLPRLGRRMQLGPTTCLARGRWMTEIQIVLPTVVKVDAARCQDILDQRSSEELSHEVVSTSEVLNRVREELSIAADIQRSFLVSERDLNRLSDGLDLGALMVPSKEIGGDLYDCVPLEAGRYLICVGDVSGKGVPAALTMSTCLTLVRSYCEVIDSPSAIMRRVNHRLCHNNSGCAFTTLFLAVLDLRSGELRYCNGGHNPSLLMRSSGGIQRLSDVHGPALGVAADVDYGETRLTLNEGETLVVYSDGASEMFNADHRRYGLERMETFFSEVDVSSCSRLIRQFMRSLRDFAGGEPQHDDITLLAIRRLRKPCSSPVEDGFLIALPNRLDSLDQVKSQLEAFATRHQLPRSLIRKLQVVCDELLSNVLRHGCNHLPEDASVELCLGLSGDCLRFSLRDPGRPFNPLDVPEPDLSLALEDRPIGGLGLHLVRNIARNCSYERSDNTNVLSFEIEK